MKNRPYIYCFNHINDCKLAEIDGNAILFIGSPSARDKTVYYVKNHQMVEDNFLPKKVMLTKMENNFLINNYQPNGMISYDDTQDELEALLLSLNFPYPRCSITLSDNALSIDINLNYKDKDNVHLLLSNYNPKQKDLLTFLREIKTTPDAMQSISFYRKGGTAIDVDDMIDLVLQAKNPFYSTVFKKIEYIGSRFKESPLTAQKKAILQDFRLYCGQHAAKGTERLELFKSWLEDYCERNQDKEDPIDILAKHRRTSFSIFNPSKTDSIKLLEDFIGQELGLEITAPFDDKVNGW